MSMDQSEIRAYCLKKAGAAECFPFGDWPVCYRVGGKIFAQVYLDKITLKCTRFAGEMFRAQYPGILVRGYHCPPVQQPYWNTVDLTQFPAEELPGLIDLAYETVVLSFSQKKQQELFKEAT